MKINLISIEDGLNNTGFRKIGAYTRQIHRNTDLFYVTTGNSRSFRHLLLMKAGSSLEPVDIDAIAAGVAGADILGFSSMTPYADLTARIIAAVRRSNPRTYIVWGGIHPIIEPEDAIRHADAICTGEGEFAFEAFVTAFRDGRPFYETPGFWFNTPDGIRKNRNLPLMSGEEMDRLPIPIYQDGEYLYKPGLGFVPIGPRDFIDFNGLSYKSIWSIGCPMRCTYCGNSKFIDYDKNYRKIRHSAAATIIAEVKDALAKHPHISTVQFDDDSFMAMPMKVLEEFSELYRREIGLPLIVTGLIPNYVRDDKLRLLISAGLNRVRMGIQSGSQAILDFYERPTPVARIRESCNILNQYRDYMIPPSFDIILDNPIETVEDNHATLDLLYEMPRPFTLNIFSLRAIPNTRLAQTLEQRGIDIDDIRTPYTRPKPTLSNILVFALVVARLPRGLYLRLRRRALPSTRPQPHYPALMMAMRFFYLCRRAADHILRLDITVLSGSTIFFLWKSGLVRLWQRLVLPRAAARAHRLAPEPAQAAEPPGTGPVRTEAG